METEFKYFGRGYKDTLVLIPGWATDYRVFDRLDLTYNYLLPLKISPADFSFSLDKAMEKESISKVGLFGWSMGGFLAADFCGEYSSKVNELILIGLRRIFDKTVIDQIAVKIERSSKAFLNRFYKDVFFADHDSYKWFRDYLMRDYLNQNSEQDLIDGLKYLANSNLDPEKISSINKIRIFHSKNDLINPFEQAFQLASEIRNSEFIALDNSSHAAFLSKEFKEAFNNG